MPSAATFPPSKIEIPSQTLDAESSLDDMFARLSSATLTVPSKPADVPSPIGPDKSKFSFGDPAVDNTATADPFRPALPKAQSQGRSALTPSASEPRQVNVTPTQALSEAKRNPIVSLEEVSRDELEAAYLQKAAAYLETLPTSPGDISHSIKGVAKKLRTTYIPIHDNFRSEEAEKLRARIMLAVRNAVNQKIKLGSEPLTTDIVKKILLDCEGDFLQLCTALFKSGHIALSDLKHVTEICQMVLDVLPKPDAPPAETSARASTVTNNSPFATLTTSSNGSRIVPASDKKTEAATNDRAQGDPLAGTKAWPSQEKREHGAYIVHPYSITHTYHH